MSNDNTDNKKQILYSNALNYHSKYRPGKIATKPSKNMESQDDLSLAYSPGVAAPCEEIYKNPDDIYKYTSRGNIVAVISNGTAVLGLGNLGPAASKPVMEGKSVLFKKFADIDSFDIEVDTTDPKEFVNIVKHLKYSWGGINLEDIKAPECFIIEEQLKKEVDIPVFHDDQHGTAIVTAAGLINALLITNRDISNIKIVVSGAGSAAIACLDMIVKLGAKLENIILCDSRGVVYKGRNAGMNEWKEKYAIDTDFRTLEEAITNADVFLGLSTKDIVTQEMVKTMAKEPIIFAMANPDPEITPEAVNAVRDDAIIATGRSDYDNQVNNVMCFPYIFRGALDVRAKEINDAMKIAAVNAIAEIARKPIIDGLHDKKILEKNKHKIFGKNYIIPTPFDNRLLTHVPVAVAKAAMKTGAARHNIDLDDYINELRGIKNT